MTFGRITGRWVLAVAMASALGLTIPACSTTRVPLPPDDATPEQVVRAYTDAVHARDCTTAEVLVNSQSQSWCGRIDITAMKVIELTQERKETGPGQRTTVERVWVNLTSQGGDISLPDGDHVWSYLLDRTGPHGAWRIYDQGMG